MFGAGAQHAEAGSALFARALTGAHIACSFAQGKGRKRKLRPEEAGGQEGVFRWKQERKK